MNFFGMGPMELILILVVALIVFGPGKMPEIGRSVGSAIREFRRASQALTSELTREVDLNELRQEVKAIQTEITQSVPYQAGGVSVELADQTDASAQGPKSSSQETVGSVAESSSESSLGSTSDPSPESSEEGSSAELPSVAATASPDKISVQKRAAQRSAAKRRDKRP